MLTFQITANAKPTPSVALNAKSNGYDPQAVKQFFRRLKEYEDAKNFQQAIQDNHVTFGDSYRAAKRNVIVTKGAVLTTYKEDKGILAHARKYQNRVKEWVVPIGAALFALGASFATVSIPALAKLVQVPAYIAERIPAQAIFFGAPGAAVALLGAGLFVYGVFFRKNSKEVKTFKALLEENAVEQAKIKSMEAKPAGNADTV
ncbi:MAG: hypothetical protein NTX79_08740 [Candidatus Micrarchaeota archaeon]|nr:hypothetical protein [Candidatus Micrarchaeota archaeon]